MVPEGPVGISGESRSLCLGVGTLAPSLDGWRGGLGNGMGVGKGILGRVDNTSKRQIIYLVKFNTTFGARRLGRRRGKPAALSVRLTRRQRVILLQQGHAGSQRLVGGCPAGLRVKETSLGY